MRALLPLLLGCTGDPIPQGLTTGHVLIAVGATRPSVDGIDVDTLDASLDGVIVDGLGPDGPESVSVLVGYTFHPLGNTDAFGFDLVQGPHRDVQITFQFGWTDELALFLAGEVAEDEEEDEEEDGSRDFQIEVAPFEVSFDLGDIEVSREPITARLQLEPAEWISALSLEGDDDEDIVVGPGSGEVYDRVVQSVLSTTTLTFESLPDDLADEPVP